MSSTVVETSTLRGMGVAVTQQQTGGKVSLLPTALASVGIDDKAVITVGYKPTATVGAALKGQPTVNVGLVYTTTVSDELEVWWCDQWRMLWNKKTKVLWPEESV
jgi:hypothetical protein